MPDKELGEIRRLLMSQQNFNGRIEQKLSDISQSLESFQKLYNKQFDALGKRITAIEIKTARQAGGIAVIVSLVMTGLSWVLSKLKWS